MSDQSTGQLARQPAQDPAGDDDLPSRLSGIAVDDGLCRRIEALAAGVEGAGAASSAGSL
jgi:hypothetical protein